MATLYLTEPQTLVKRDGETLIVHIPENEEKQTPKRKVRVPLLKVDRVVVHGTSTLTSPAIAALMEKRAEVTFLNRYGKYQGHLAHGFTRNGQLRLKQSQAHLDWPTRHKLSKAFVYGKLANMRTMLLRFNRKRQHDALANAADTMKTALTNVKHLQPDAEAPQHTNPQTESAWGRLHGLEGSATAAYFGCYRHILTSPELFNGRTRRPPRDPANALLSFGYTILLNQVMSAICTVGLDPYIGFLHSTRYGKPALALDLMEEFRPIIVDSTVITLINNQALTANDFVEQFGAYRLTEHGRRTFLTKLEARFDQTLTHPTFNYKATYRRAIELQARLLAKTIQGEIPTYEPFIIR